MDLAAILLGISCTDTIVMLVITILLLIREIREARQKPPLS